MKQPQIKVEVVGTFTEQHAKALMLVSQKIWVRVAKERMEAQGNA